MAIYYCRMSTVSAAAGNSAVASAAYQSGEKLKRELDGKTRNYAYKHRDVLGPTGILLPDSAPKEFADRGTLWNSVEKFESSKMGEKARFARSWVFAIPGEIPPEMQEQLVREFCQKQFVDRGMIADFAIHRNPGNSHFHVKTTCRPMKDGEWIAAKSRKVYDLDEHKNRIPVLDKNGNQKKDKRGGRIWKSHKETINDWDSVKVLEAIRAGWSETANKYLERISSDARIDHRSYKDRGLPYKGQIHLGPDATALERKGVKTIIGLKNELIRIDNSIKHDELEYKALKHEMHKRIQKQLRKDLMRRLPWRLDERITAADAGIEVRKREIAALAPSRSEEEAKQVPSVAKALEALTAATEARKATDARIEEARKAEQAIKDRIKKLEEQGRPSKIFFQDRKKYDNMLFSLKYSKLDEAADKVQGATFAAEPYIKAEEDARQSYKNELSEAMHPFVSLPKPTRERITTLKREIACLALIRKHAEHRLKTAETINKTGKLKGVPANQQAREWAAEQQAAHPVRGGGGGGSASAGRSADALLERYAGHDASLPAVAANLQREDRDNGLDRWELLSEAARADKEMEAFLREVF